MLDSLFLAQTLLDHSVGSCDPCKATRNQHNFFLSDSPRVIELKWNKSLSHCIVLLDREVLRRPIALVGTNLGVVGIISFLIYVPISHERC